ncbi:MAG: hypothetical protein V7719_02455 [Psychroserpens sp.]
MPIIVSSCAYDLDEHLKINPILETQDAIGADSDLFDNLKDIGIAAKSRLKPFKDSPDHIIWSIKLQCL